VLLKSNKALGVAAREVGNTHRPVNLVAGVRVITGIYHTQRQYLR